MPRRRVEHAGRPFGDEGVASLVASGALAGVTELRLWDGGIGDAGAETLAGCSALAGLRTLDLGWNRIGPRGAEALAASPHPVDSKR